jgi:transcriptional regulator with XRE-family HTH domain
MEIGHKIKEIRLAKGLTSVELADKAGVGQSTISMTESDSRSPQIDTVEKICLALEIAMVELLPLEHQKATGNYTSSEESDVIELLQKLSYDERKHFFALFKSLLTQRK